MFHSYKTWLINYNEKNSSCILHSQRILNTDSTPEKGTQRKVTHGLARPEDKGTIKEAAMGPVCLGTGTVWGWCFGRSTNKIIFFFLECATG